MAADRAVASAIRRRFGPVSGARGRSLERSFVAARGTCARSADQPLRKGFTACNRIHRLDQRAARWLLQVDERVEEKPFAVTQDFLAQMIGVQRPALSLAMRQFKDAGLVTYSRGQISIADRDGLLAKSCACITVIAAEADRLRNTLDAPRP